MRRTFVLSAISFAIAMLLPTGAFAQVTSGVGVKLGTLGIGVQAAVSPAPRVAIRGGFNAFSYSRSFDHDGLTWDGTLKLQSIEANLDLFLLGGFRVTPGVLLRNNNHIDATVSVPENRVFTLGQTDYTSRLGSPVKGTGLVDFRKVTPMLAIGFGSLAPHGNRHVTFAVDLGLAFEDKPDVSLTLTGDACVVRNGVATCAPINTLPGVSANIEAERARVATFLGYLRYYPVGSIAIGYRF